MNYDEVSAHNHSARNYDEIRRSGLCGCFFCLETFAPEVIKEWENEKDGYETALCPFCGIDAVSGSASGFPIEKEEFLRLMNMYWS